MKDAKTREPSVKELTNEQLTSRIAAAKNDGDVLTEIAELNRRKSDVEKADS